MALWKRPQPTGAFAERHAATLPSLLGIQLVELGEDHARATMPVDDRHIQPAGILHGGASVVLAETLGSVCGVMALEEGWTVVGLEVNANHLAPVFKGDTVEATCRPLQLGRSVQVWQIEMRRGDGRLCCVSRLTTAVRELRGEGVAPPGAGR